ncbi:hypothetical protein IE986_09245 [Klebsiella pneumoniae]|uniref:Uncharacterized protein n=1 Tax=Klebsiella pneumoniae TaxID=573 RepID=A0A927HI86_KLEPN|nr:hypothetical protein [Klebsiella pneumoniae]
MKWKFTAMEKGISRVTACYTESFHVLEKNGALTERIVKDIPDGTIGYAAIIQKEDDFLEFKCPHFIELGDSRRFLNIEVSRGRWCALKIWCIRHGRLTQQASKAAWLFLRERF